MPGQVFWDACDGNLEKGARRHMLVDGFWDALAGILRKRIREHVLGDVFQDALVGFYTGRE